VETTLLNYLSDQPTGHSLNTRVHGYINACASMVEEWNKYISIIAEDRIVQVIRDNLPEAVEAQKQLRSFGIILPPPLSLSAKTGRGKGNDILVTGLGGS
jgi:hypothetical protein